jgi:hypothetical protein
MQPVFAIKPDVKTVCLINVIKVVAAVVIIVAVVTYLGQLVDFGIIGESIGITSQDLPETGQVVMNFALAAMLASLLTFVVSYLSASKRQYAFFPDHVEIYDNFLIFNVSQKNVPLLNVVSVRASREGEKKIFGLGKVVIELTGLQEKSADLDDLRNPEQFLPYIQRLVDQHKSAEQAQFTYNQNIQRTLDKKY